MTQQMNNIAIIGAGPVGCLAALAFSNAYPKSNVTLYEYRDDPRSVPRNERQLRSINLALSSRGLLALEEIAPNELITQITELMIPMHGRMIHSLEASLTGEDTRGIPQDYGLYGESINSIDRGVLNDLLLNEVETKGITVCFGYKLVSIDFFSCQPLLNFANGKSVNVDFVVGSDGAYSKVRQEMQRCMRIDFSQEYIDSAYIELYIPPGKDGKWVLSPNHLHIWPRDEFMLIALANPDGSFTSTFFGPWKMTNDLKTREKVVLFFQQFFPDALQIIGEDCVVKCFLENPRGSLFCVECKPYHFENKCIILGDAAHCMVPFYGQGMNCGFEDVRVLLDLLQTQPTLEIALSQYSATRHADLCAIVQLAKDNYKEMSQKVTSKLFLLRKTLDRVLSRTLGDYWLPLYTMVSFRPDIPYHKAISIEKNQKKIIGYLLNTMAFGTVVAGYSLYKRLSRA